MIEFKKITMEDQALIKEHLIHNDNLCCEFSFSNNILWDKEGQMRYALLDDVLLYRLIMEKDQVVVYCTPDFKGQCSKVLGCIDEDAKQFEYPYIITCLSETMVSEIKENCGEDCYEFSSNRNSSDYIYLVEKLATLSGGKYHKKKNHLNQFKKSYSNYAYEEISSANIDECREMKEEWMLRRKENGTFSDSLAYESMILDHAFDDYGKFGFTGGLIRVDGDVKAFTLGEQLSENTFVTHFEKAMDDVVGIYAAINQQFAEHSLLGKYEYVNREEDMGLEGLRQAKMSYNPQMIYEKYVARKL